MVFLWSELWNSSLWFSLELLSALDPLFLSWPFKWLKRTRFSISFIIYQAFHEKDRASSFEARCWEINSISWISLIRLCYLNLYLSLTMWTNICNVIFIQQKRLQIWSMYYSSYCSERSQTNTVRFLFLFCYTVWIRLTGMVNKVISPI